jgi:hypothetical protein
MENAKEGGVDGVKNRSGQWEGPGGGSLTGALCTGYPLVRTKHHRLSEEHKSRNDSRRRCCNTGKSNGGEMDWPRFVR